MELKIDFDKMRGLAPAIVQDAGNGDVLMLGFMNDQAYDRTLSSGYVTFYSRTRNELWTKGETSGNRLKVVSASTDCVPEGGSTTSRHLACATRFDQSLKSWPPGVRCSAPP